MHRTFGFVGFCQTFSIKDIKNLSNRDNIQTGIF